MIEYLSHNYIHPQIQISQYSEPFKYIIIDNLLKDSIYNSVSQKFLDLFKNAKQYKDTPGATSNYEGYIVGLQYKDLYGGYDFFVSNELRNFASQSFDIKINKYVALAGHYHTAPAKRGFIHRDANICSFYDDGKDIVLNNAFYTDDSVSKQPTSIKVMRSIAMLYYLNNTSIESGGTGIYDGYAGNLLKNIEPVNNRLFLFEINHKSFHTFMGADFNRSAIVCWYHSSPSYILNKYRTVIESNPNFIERWTQNPEGGYWDVKQDPEHNR